MSSSTRRIAVVHNKVMPYRKPFFERLEERYEVDFLIFDDSDADIDSLRVKTVSPTGVVQHLYETSYDLVLVPDIIFREGWIASVTAWLKDVPIILWTETWDWPNKTVYQRIKSAALVKMLDRCVDGYIVPGSKSKEFLLRHTKSDSMDIRRVPNATHVSPESHSSGLTKSDIGIPPDNDVVLFLGELSERKGVDTLLRACERLERKRDNFTLLVCGTGNDSYTEQLKSLSAKLDLDSVRFYGWVDDENVFDIYSLANVYVLLSTHDPFPLSVVEAMSAGTPAVVSEGVGEAHDLVRDGETGYVVRNGSPCDAAIAINEILTCEVERQEMSSNCEEYISEHVTYDDMVNGLGQGIQHILEFSNRPSEC